MRLMVDSTRLPPLAALGSSTRKLARTMAAEVNMKITSSTRTMSTKGMMLIDARTPSSSAAASFRAPMSILLCGGVRGGARDCGAPAAGGSGGSFGGRPAHVGRLELGQQDAGQQLRAGDGVLDP